MTKEKSIVDIQSIIKQSKTQLQKCIVTKEESKIKGKEQRICKTINKMTKGSPYLSIITLNYF